MDKKDAAIYKALEKIKEATVVAKPAKKPTIQTKPITKAPIAKVSTGGHLKPVKK